MVYTEGIESYLPLVNMIHWKYPTKEKATMSEIHIEVVPNGNPPTIEVKVDARGKVTLWWGRHGIPVEFAAGLSNALLRAFYRSENIKNKNRKASHD